VDSVRIAIEKARQHGHDLAGSVLVSDALIPFAEGPQRRARRA
jgi:AICAR transformylase/IMP cyclohydrolase PurH